MKRRAEARRPGPRRPRELAAGLVHLARQRAHVERQGPRVLPQALPRHPHQPDREGARARAWSRTSSGATRPEGKLDLVVDLNFRMDTSALYSDIVLPAATWYEKADLNSTDLHSFIHPLSEAVPPAWESQLGLGPLPRHHAEDGRARGAAPARAGRGPRDDAARPRHARPRSPSPTIQDWAKGECEPIPGKTMPSFKIVTRDYRTLHQRFVALGPGMREGIGAHGDASSTSREQYDELLATRPTVEVDGERLPSIREAHEAADVILHLAPETNGEIAYKGYQLPRAEDGPAARRPRRGRPGRAGHLQGPAGPAAAAAEQPLLVRAGDRRPLLLGLHHPGRAAAAVAHADRPPAPLPRPPGLHRLRRAPAHLQAGAAAGRSTATCGRASRTASCSTT